jgi:ribonuclease BN (tRNA processing enzyme)
MTDINNLSYTAYNVNNVQCKKAVELLDVPSNNTFLMSKLFERSIVYSGDTGECDPA